MAYYEHMLTLCVHICSTMYSLRSLALCSDMIYLLICYLIR